MCFDYLDVVDFQCQIGVLPLGTGNDLARVLGWGSAFDDDTQLPAVLEKMEHAQIKMLDRWSIMTYEASMPPPRKVSQQVPTFLVHFEDLLLLTWGPFHYKS